MKTALAGIHTFGGCEVLLLLTMTVDEHFIAALNQVGNLDNSVGGQVPSLAYDQLAFDRGTIVSSKRGDLVLYEPDAEFLRTISDTSKVGMEWEKL